MDNERDKKKKKVNPGTIVAIVIALAVAEPELFSMLLVIALVAAFLAGPIFLILRARKQNGNTAKAPSPSQRAPRFDDCPKPICFHKDRGEHHIRKGKEIDPWDRPDIDISKYQHKQ